MVRGKDNISYKDKDERRGFQGLDNKRIPCQVNFIRLEYKGSRGTLTVKKRQAVSRSGYCFDFEDNLGSLDNTDIGALHFQPSELNVYITTYEEYATQASWRIIRFLKHRKQERIRIANSIVIPKPICL